MIGRPPKLAYLPFSVVSKIAERVVNWEYFSLDRMIKNQLDLIVKQKTNTIEDLYVRPVSFP